MFVFVLIVFAFSAQPPPNILYLGSGYDVFKGSPLCGANGVDEGLKASVFNVMDFTNSKARGTDYLLPSGVSLRSAMHCDTSFTSEVVESKEAYSNLMKKSVSFSASFEVDAVFASGSASFSYSQDALKVRKGTSMSHNAYVYATARCTLYKANLRHYNAPDLDDTFSMALKTLPRSFSDKNKEVFFQFFDSYGTHLVTRVIMGGSYTVRSKFTHTAMTSFQRDKIDISTAASVSASYMGIGGSTSFEMASSTDKESSRAFEKKRLEKKSCSLGSRPDKSGDVKNWAANANIRAVPVKTEIAPISEFTYYKGKRQYVLLPSYKKRAFGIAIKAYKKKLDKELKGVAPDKPKWMRKWYEKADRCPDGWSFVKTDGIGDDQIQVICEVDPFIDDKNLGICFDNSRFQNDKYFKLSGKNRISYPRMFDRCGWANKCKVNWKGCTAKFNEYSDWSMSYGICPDKWYRVGNFKALNNREYVVCRAKDKTNRGNGRCEDTHAFQYEDLRCSWARKCGVQWKVCQNLNKDFVCPFGWELNKNGMCYAKYPGAKCSPVRFWNVENYDGCDWAKYCGYPFFPGCERSKAGFNLNGKDKDPYWDDDDDDDFDDEF